MATPTRLLSTRLALLHSGPLLTTSPIRPLRARRKWRLQPSHVQSRHATVRRRLPSDPQPPKPRPDRQEPMRPVGEKVWFPKTRLAIGVVFIGALVYSMITTPLQRQVEGPMGDSSRTDSTSPPYDPKSSSTKVLNTEAPSIAEKDARTKRESGVGSSSPMRLRMEALIKEEQQNIIRALEEIEKSAGSLILGGQPPKIFRTDKWTRPAGGEGISCVLQDGAVFEKAGVNTSIVYGTLPRAAIQRMRVNHKALDDPDIDSLQFFAAGLSIVLHPRNPMAPTVHLNYRYFETMDDRGQGKAWWFGGGTDLTPSYLFDEDAIHFHRTIKEVCDRHHRGYYPRFKKWCDEYFYVKHRGECRGVGGIFFDDLDEEENDQESLFSFVQDGLRAFMPSYLPILKRRMLMPYGESEKDWQQLRRGRYVEFNLVHDRGTRFGLETPGARVESILMSLPLTARWVYMHEPEKGSREDKLVTILKQPAEWV